MKPTPGRYWAYMLYAFIRTYGVRRGVSFWRRERRIERYMMDRFEQARRQRTMVP